MEVLVCLSCGTIWSLFIVNLFLIHHRYRSLNFDATSDISVFKFALHLRRAVSSANNRLFSFATALLISWMYKAKRSGPRTDPCGTPHFTSHIEESTSFITVYCFLLLFACPRIPYLSNLSSNISWSTVSKAFVGWMKILMAYFPSSRMFLILSVNSTSANVVECSLRNPNWKLNSILFTSRNSFAQ